MELFFKSATFSWKFFSLFLFFSFLQIFFFLFLFFSLCSSPPHTPSHTKTFYIPLMMSILVIMGVIVLLMMIVVEGDDTQALRNTISSLCSLNKVGQFASCCKDNDNGAFITLANRNTWICFITAFSSTTGSSLTYLFVICFSFLCCSSLFDDCH